MGSNDKKWSGFTSKDDLFKTGGPPRVTQIPRWGICGHVLESLIHPYLPSVILSSSRMRVGTVWPPCYLKIFSTWFCPVLNCSFRAGCLFSLFESIY